MNKQNIKKKLVMLTICNLIFFITVMNSMSSTTAIIWSEDFEDDLSDWTLTGFDWVADSWWAGNVTIDDGVLWAQGAENSNETEELSFIYRNSTNDKGTWSFDMYVDDHDGGETFVWFMTDNWAEREDFSHMKGYEMMVLNYKANTTDNSFYMESDNGDPTFRFVNRDGTPDRAKTLGFYTPSGGVTGWHSIIVTRNVLGLFKVYFDEILRITVTDKNVTQSTMFAMGTDAGHGYDNITVRDDIWEPPTTTTEPDPSPTTTTTTTSAAAAPPFAPIFVSLVLIATIVKSRRK